MTDSVVPQWLHDLHTYEHIEEVISVLAKRERARDNARNRSRRYSASSRKGRGVGGKIMDAVTVNAPSSEELDFYSVSIGALPENRHGNRYHMLEPYDRTRVVVGEGAKGELSQGNETNQEGRYINANWVRELMGGKWWIATQAPLPATVHAFLSVILQPISRPPQELHPSHAYASATTRVRTVVQLTPNFEKGMQKAHLYFPAEVGQAWHMEAEPGHDAPDIEVKLLASHSHDVAQCIQSTVSIRPLEAASQNTQPIVFNHLLYGAWPDHGVPAPEERASLLEFARLVDRTNRGVTAVPAPHRYGLDPDPPIMVGCSAGIGRTGSFIALCSLLRANGFLPPPPHNSAAKMDEPHPPLPASPLGALPKELADDPVAQEVDSLREQRPGMVQRPEQIVLVYEALALAFVQRGA